MTLQERIAEIRERADNDANADELPDIVNRLTNALLYTRAKYSACLYTDVRPLDSRLLAILDNNQRRMG